MRVNLGVLGELTQKETLTAALAKILKGLAGISTIGATRRTSEVTSQRAAETSALTMAAETSAEAILVVETLAEMEAAIFRFQRIRQMGRLGC